MHLALNQKWQIIAWDSALETASGFARCEVLGLNFVEDLAVLSDRVPLLKNLNRAYHSQDEVLAYAFVLYSKSCAPIKLLLDASPFFDIDGSVIGVSIIARHDASCQQETPCNEMHFALDSRWRIIAWNGAAERVSRFQRGDVLGYNFGDFIAYADFDDFKELMNEGCEKNTEVRDFSFILYSKNASPNQVLLDMTPYFADDFGKPAGVSIIARHALQNASKESGNDVAHTISKASEVLTGGTTSKIKDTSVSTTPTTIPTMGELPPLLSTSASNSSLRDDNSRDEFQAGEIA